MKILQDKQIKHFTAWLLLLLVFLLIGQILLSAKEKTEVQRLLLTHDTAVVSALLDQGVSEHVIAKAITSTSAQASGVTFLNQLGISENTDRRFLPFLRDFQRKMNILTLCQSSLFILLLLLIVIRFLTNRERLYEHAIKTVDQYTDSDFSILLPSLEQGGIYQLFARINTMATALKAKQESENKTKEFLKTTVSDISHQLKTPIAALSMYQEILLQEPDNAETVMTFTQKSGMALDRIETLIQSLLKITRLDAGGIDFRKALYPISEVISQSLEGLADRAKNEQKELIIDGSADVAIFCDLQWTREAIGSVIKNALDHTPNQGKISIGWEQTPMMVRISVTDNGSGIQLEDLHHIFKRFYRSKNSLDTQGIGLGLSLAKSIVEGQAGTIAVESQPGDGTTFTLSFPTHLTKL